MWPFDQNNQGMYQQYAQAYDTGNFNGFEHHQVLGHLLQFIQGAPPDMQHQIYQQHFAQMPYEQRVFLAQQVPPQYGMDPNNPMSMSQSFVRLGQEQPHILRQILSHPMLMGVGFALVGLMAKHMLTHHQNQQYGQNQYSQAGFNQGYNQGFNQGYDPNAGQYNQGGFQQGQYNQAGFNQGYNQGGYQQGYDPNAGQYSQGGYGQGQYNQGGYNQGFNQGQYNQGGYGQDLQQELNQERREEQELRRELRAEERREERLEEREGHHHHRREEY